MTLYFLLALLQRTPVLLLILAGILFSIARWRRHSKASLITLIALGFYLIKFFVFTALSYWLPTLRQSMHLSYAAINNLYTLLNVVNDIAFSVVIVLLIAAAFANRQTMPATSSWKENI